MPKPVLLAVDEAPRVVSAVERELRRRYDDDYEVMVLSSGEEAVAALTRLSDASREVALVLWGDRGYDIEETDVLERVRQLHPVAKRALLVPWRAWADRDMSGVILRSMARGRIDYYVLEPVRSPDELFHERVSNFLYEWTKERGIASYATRVVGHPWSRRSHEVMDLLKRNGVPIAFCSTESPEGRELRAAVGHEDGLPLVIFPDGRLLSDPDNVEIAEAWGMAMPADGDEFDVVIVGGGPAGLSAAVYGASEGLATLVVEQHAIGGQAGSSSLIRNYLGFPRGITGADLAGQAYQQAWIFGAKFAFMRAVTNLEQINGQHVLTLSDGTRVAARAVVLATGVSYRRLDAPGVEDLQGAGVFYGSGAAEAQLLEGQAVYVVGGANSAGQAALHVARHARQVTLLAREPSLLAMSDYLVEEIHAAENLTVRTETSVVRAEGDGRLERLVLRDGSGAEESVDAAALFILIGAMPHTAWLPDAIVRDADGFVLTGSDLPADAWPLDRSPHILETSLPGVLAVGDVRHGSTKRVATAVGEGSIAIQAVHALALAERPGAVRRAASGDVGGRRVTT